MRRSIDDFKEKVCMSVPIIELQADHQLMAPTMLFLAAKIEEEPLKLRYIVNTCLAKWVKNPVLWEPDRGSKDVSLAQTHSNSAYQQQSRDYQAWEREILAAEEMALDALCFDMNVDHPRRVLQRGLIAVEAVEGIEPLSVEGIAMLLLDHS